MNTFAPTRLLLRLATAALLTLLHGAAAAADPNPLPPSWGLHGMLLFGGADGIFASHLPMFHAPHDRQVVFALRIDDPKLDAQLRRQLGAKPAIWTLVPEKFELARMAPNAANPLTRFRADIVQGHFERDGTTRLKDVTVRVVKVERFETLDPGAKPGRQAHYRPVGAGTTWFMVKDLTARPDFDHVVAVRGPSQPEAFDVAVRGVKKPSDAALRKHLPRGDKLLGSVYFDTADLE